LFIIERSSIGDEKGKNGARWEGFHREKGIIKLAIRGKTPLRNLVITVIIDVILKKR